jgi:hypothetical protein
VTWVLRRHGRRGGEAVGGSRSPSIDRYPLLVHLGVGAVRVGVRPCARGEVHGRDMEAAAARRALADISGRGLHGAEPGHHRPVDDVRTGRAQPCAVLPAATENMRLVPPAPLGVALGDPLTLARRALSGQGAPLERDQQIAGGLMFTLAELVGMPFLTGVFVTWWRAERSKTAGLDARLGRELLPPRAPISVGCPGRGPANPSERVRSRWETEEGEVSARIRGHHRHGDP